MNDKEYEFENDNHYNLFLLSQAMRLVVTPDSKFAVEEQEWFDRYKVSLGGLVWYVGKAFLPRFWLLLSECQFQEVIVITESEDNNVNFVQAPFIENIKFEFNPKDPFYQLTGEDYVNVEDRIGGLIKAAAAVIRDSAKEINLAIDRVARDTDIVKDFDGILTYDTPLGKDFNLVLCFDKVQPISDDNSSITIERTPITKEDQDKYLGETGKKVQAKIKYINELVTNLLESKAVSRNPHLVEYAGNLITGTLVNAFLNQTIVFISFGGRDHWSVLSKDTPNNVACMKILDAEVERLIKYLDGLEKTEGVDIYSFDLDTFAIFGRNFDNRVVTPALQGHTQAILDRYSKGFEDTLTARMSMIDNQHFFKG